MIVLASLGFFQMGRYRNSQPLCRCLGGCLQPSAVPTPEDAGLFQRAFRPLRQIITGWWLGTLLFSHILGIIIIITPIDELMFFRGVGFNHQPDQTYKAFRCFQCNDQKMIVFVFGKTMDAHAHSTHVHVSFPTCEMRVSGFDQTVGASGPQPQAPSQCPCPIEFQIECRIYNTFIYHIYIYIP